MLVYGDRSRMVRPEELILDIARALAEADGARRGERIDRVTRALILAGELAQGVADAAAEAAGADDITPATTAALDLAIAVAGLLFRPAADTERAIAALRRLSLPARIRCKTPEGYAFYALYPERYAAAVEVEAPLVIGLRSIGTSLAAAVAARLRCPALTVRPGGHPFRRVLRVSKSLQARLVAHRGSYVIVDEGPGFSGSTFGATADLLERCGVSRGRIVFVPTHARELGTAASPAHRERYARARRQTADAPIPPSLVAGWFADIVGPDAKSEDISGGAWRNTLLEARRPPAAPATERLKFRFAGREGVSVARFAGLGAIGEQKLETARRLHAAGFTPEPLALRRGFLLERWASGTQLAGPVPLDHLARYLGFRCRELPAGESDGASLADLHQMAVTNAAELLDKAAADAIAGRLEALGSPALVPVRIDGRLHPWEWLLLPAGTLLKTDALDHACGHDLVGCQDIAWDVAGAAVEFALPPDTTEALRAGVAARAGRPVDPRAVAAFRLCYAAFQAGSWSMLGEPGPCTAAQIARYAAVLRRAAAAPALAERT